MRFLLAVSGFLSAFTDDVFAQTTHGSLRLEVTTAYNFIVDSNVESPSTNAPRSAYISARLWNDGTVPITNVRAYIGNKVANTPGVYPSRAHLSLNGPSNGIAAGGEFSLTHEGGSLGVLDATRQFPEIPAGGYIPVYWLVSYPNLDMDGNSVTGGSKPDDDLYLDYDIWATGNEGVTPRAVDVRRRATMRNCISAMANKIFPNGANKVPQEYLDLLAKYAPEWNNLAEDGSPGTSITTEGIWYDLGNVGQGFDNDGNLVPDQNAWLQPVGDPTKFDSSAFRLERTFALIVVKLKDGGEQVYDVGDQLYFTNIPENNGVVGLVRYDYRSLKSGVTSVTSPYQMAASGFENEKFNGDYGASFGVPIANTALTLNKSVNLASANPGNTLNYTINFANPGAQTVGDPEIGLPIVIQETIPAGTKFAVGTAASTPPSGTTFEIRYSSDNGVTWTTTAPANQTEANAVDEIQWWLSAKLAPAGTGTATFSVIIDNPYLSGSGSPIINVAGLSFGNSDTFLTDDAFTGINGSRVISGTVYEDTGVGTGGIYGDAIRNGTEPVITNVDVRLYYDINNNNLVDSGDILLSTNANATGNYSFTGLPNGEYVVQVNRLDTSLPTGYTPTSAEVIAVTLSGSDSTGNNFGFAPTLIVTKTGTTSVYTGGTVTYTIGVQNKYTAVISNVYDRYAGTATTPTQANQLWTNHLNAIGAPDTSVANASFNNAGEQITLGSFPNIPATDTITSVALRVTGYGTQIGAGNANGQLVPTSSKALTGTSLDDITDTNFNTVYPTPYTMQRNLTAASWSPTEFSSFTITLSTDKPNTGDADFNLDSVGLRITATQSNSLVTIPMTDTYNADELQFVSATDGAVNSVSGSVGTITWSDITGASSLASNATKNVTVTFTAKPLSGASSITTTDTARVTGALFENGGSANNGEASAQTVILPTSSIGDTIFTDANRSGGQDLSETGISGVTVQLYQGITLIATDVTDSNGNYLFENLIPGTYEVRVTTASGPLSGWALSADPDLDGVPYDPLNPDTLGDSRTTSTLSAGEYYAGADFGYYPPGYELSGTAWIDFDNDGLVDEGEVGIQYVTVNLYNGSNTLIGTTTTDAEGAYTFVGLSNGNYRIEVITTPTPTAFPPNLTQTYDPDVTINNETNVTIASADIENINFGYRYAGTNALSGTIGLDTDPGFDGLLNGTNASGVAVGETALAGVTVYLYAWNDPDDDNIIDSGESVLLGSTVTDANGDYSFSGLPASEFYLVSMAAPYNNLLITTTTSTTGHPASLVVPSSNSQGHTTGAYAVVPAASAITNIDFAFISAVDYDFGDLPASYSTLFSNNGARHIRPLSPNLYLGASVSIETDGQPSSAANLDTFDNGVTVTGIFWQNEDDGGTASVNVVGSGFLVGYIDFNNDGDFLDPNEYVPIQAVNTGTHNISFDIPAGTLDEDGSTGLYARFRLLPTEPFIPALSYSGEVANGEVEDYLWNFHSITGTVFGDADDDDLLAFNDPGDIFLNGVQVQLWHNSVMIDSQVTGLDGSYSFYGLTPDNYEIKIVPSGYTALFDADGVSNSYTEIDVSVTNATVTTRDFLLGNGGSFPSASLSGTVFIDTHEPLNNDFSLGDAVYSGVSVSLYRDLDNDGTADSGELVGSLVTDSSGNYSFPNLADGNYLVIPTSSTGYIKDVDGSGNGNNKIAATMAGVSITGRNFLYDTNASIAGNIKIDTTGDTVGETNQTGVVVQLLASDNTVLATTTTDGSGNYSFIIATAGNYKVRQVVPTSYYAVGDIDGGNLEIIGDTTLIAVANGANVTGQNFVNRELCSVGDFVWYDNDEDGIKDAIELGINGITVRLLNSSNLVIATTTTANNGSSQPGYYSFTDLETGVYKVEFVLPDEDYVFSPLNADSLGLLTGAANSDAALSSGRTNSFTLTPGLDTLNVDAGIYQSNPCPDDWTNWKQIHPGELATGNPDADAYANFTEFAFAMPYNNGIGNDYLDHTAWIVRESTNFSNTLEGVFVRPKGAYLNVVYTLQYAASTGNPTVWSEVVIDTSLTGNATVVDNGDCTETVTILDLEGLTNLTGGTGVVRIMAELDDDGGNDEVDLTTYVETEGWTRTGLAGICQTYNIPYVRESVFTGTVSSVSGQDLIFNNHNLTSLLGSGSYYLEVTSGDHEGKRYDVSATSGTGVTLLSDSNVYDAAPFNTAAGAPPGTATFAGDTVAIRRHWTLGDALIVTDFTASSLPTTADQVQIFSNGGWTTYWVNDLGDANPLTARWVLLGDVTLADQSGVVLPPGYGLFFTRRGTATTNLSFGEIRNNDFIRPLQQGSNLVGGGYPVDQSPLGNGNREMARGASGVGFFGSGDFKYADSIFVWKRDANPAAAGTFDTYYLAYAPSISVDKWIRQGDISLASKNAETLMLDDRAVFIRSKENLPTYTIPSPWTP